MIDATIISVSLPIKDKWDAILSDDYSTQGYLMVENNKIRKCCPCFSGIYNLLLNSNPVGNIGRYKCVYDLRFGIEGYTPDIGSNPGEGKVGVEEILKVFIFTTYCDMSIIQKQQIDTFIQKISEIHPWEHPMIRVRRENIYSGNYLDT